MIACHTMSRGWQKICGASGPAIRAIVDSHLCIEYKVSTRIILNKLSDHFMTINKHVAGLFVVNLREIGAGVNIAKSYLCKWDLVPDKWCSFLIVSISKGLSMCFMCFDQHVKYWTLCKLFFASILLLDYHVR